MRNVNLKCDTDHSSGPVSSRSHVRWCEQSAVVAAPFNVSSSYGMVWFMVSFMSAANEKFASASTIFSVQRAMHSLPSIVSHTEPAISLPCDDSFLFTPYIHCQCRCCCHSAIIISSCVCVCTVYVAFISCEILHADTRWMLLCAR